MKTQRHGHCYTTDSNTLVRGSIRRQRQCQRSVALHIAGTGPRQGFLKCLPAGVVRRGSESGRTGGTSVNVSVGRGDFD